MDNVLINSCFELSKSFGIKEIEFVHVIPKFISKVNIPAKLNRIEKDLTNTVRQLITEKVDNRFLLSADIAKYRITILEGSASDLIIEMTNKNEYDLLIFGKKIKSTGSGITPRRIAKNVKNNILIIPEKKYCEFQNILIPIDFSENSIRALQTALQIQSGNSCKIIPLHILTKFRAGNYLDLKLSEEQNQYYLAEAENEWKSVQSKLELEMNKYKMHYIKNLNRNNASILSEYVANHEIDLVVIGAQGKSNLQKILYGSVAESFVDNNLSAVTLIIR